MACTYGGDDVFDGVDDDDGVLEHDVVTAVGLGDVLGARHELGDLTLGYVLGLTRTRLMSGGRSGFVGAG